MKRRAFYIDEDNQAKRLSMASLRRFTGDVPGHNCQTDKFWQSQAGKQIKVVEASLNDDNQVSRLDFTVFYVDDQGYWSKEQIKDLGEVASPKYIPSDFFLGGNETEEEKRQEEELQREYTMIRERYDRLYHWEPTKELERDILSAVFESVDR